jgi:hypothetical protein
MMMRRFLITGLALALLCESAPVLAKVPDTWDGLTRVRGGRSEEVYLLPGADFRSYTKVMIDVPEVAFQKDWQRNQNESATFGTGQVTDQDIRNIINEASARFLQSLSQAYTKDGYAVVPQPGSGVLRLSTAIVNLTIAAPDTNDNGMSSTFTQNAGQATLVVEARDAVSGTLLGRSIDAQIIGDGAPFRRDSMSNRADFEQQLSTWAKMSAAGLGKLKANSPIDAEGAVRR